MNAYDIPVSVNIDGVDYKIRNRGDYRVVLDCFAALNDAELSTSERIFAALIIFYEDLNDLTDVFLLDNLKAAIDGMYNFFQCGESSATNKAEPKLVDWKKDAQLISSAINKIAGKELRLEPYVHWWTFMGYYMAIGDCPLSTVIGIRSKIVKGKHLEKHEREFRNNNPEFFVWDRSTVEQKEAQLWVDNVWNKEGRGA